LQPDGTVLHASAINSRGQTVGQAFKRGRSQAFQWERGLPPNLATLGGPRAAAVAINDHGTAAGWSIPSEGGLETAHACIWQQGRMIDMGTLGGNHSRAYSVNNAGQVVGFSSRSDKQSAAFLWEKGRMMDLNGLLKTNVYHLSGAYDINDRGQIVAVGMRAGRWRACLVNPPRIKVPTPALVHRQEGNAHALFRGPSASTAVQLAQFQSFELVSGGNVEMLFHGDPGSNYQIETSTNLVDWFRLGEAQPRDGQFRFVDTNAANFDVRFYRVIQER
jgi:probable HAF family extracellular repeat protein